MAKSPMFNPFALWTDLGMQTASMMLASAQVIQHRTARMAQASFPLSARDTAEFTQMGVEKVEAAMESLQAASLSMMALNPMTGLKTWHSLSDHSATTALKALHPIRKRAMANAKRLGKIKT